MTETLADQWLEAINDAEEHCDVPAVQRNVNEAFFDALEIDAVLTFKDESSLCLWMKKGKMPGLAVVRRATDEELKAALEDEVKGMTRQ